MKSASPALIALLSGNQFMYADLFTISLIGGGTLYYTNADGGLTYNGNYYTPTSPRINRSGAKSSIGVTVDTMTIQIFGTASELIQGVPFPQFAANGGFDGATVSVDRCYMNSFGDVSAGTLNVFFGNVSETRPSRSAVELTVSSMLELLNVSMPRNLISPGCIHNLFDAGCGLVKSSFGVSGAVATGSTSGITNTTLTHATDYFTLGTISFTSGVNSGESVTVKQHSLSGSTATVVFAAPLLTAPAAGDTFNIYPGCDKAMSTCSSAKFNNLANFRGWPFVPSPSASM